jgi:antitoxin ParD1/3/4
MATATINISMPDSLKSEVEEVLKEDGYGNASEFFRELVRNHLRERENRKLETLLLQGLQSGEATPLTRDDFAAIRERGLTRVKERKSK